MAVNPDSGNDYGADTPVQRFAIRKVVRGEDGLPKVIYLDAQTGEQINNLAGYQVITAGNKDKFEATKTDKTDGGDEDKTTARRINEGVTDYDQKSGEGGSRSGSGLGGFDGFNNPFDRSVGNNYGYINTPRGLTLAGFIPGPIGTIAKTADRAIGLSNTVAANKARQTMGLGNLGIASSIGNVLGLRDESKIADVNVNNRNYSVGFEALSPLGQTTLTPNEARMRGLVTGTPLTELTRKESKERNNSWKESEYAKKNTGLIGGLRNAISGLFGGGSSNYGLNDFPDAPAPVTNSNSFYDNFGGGGGDAQDSPIGGYYGDDGNDGNGGYNTPSGLGGSAPGGGFSVGDVADSLGGSSGDFGGGFSDGSSVGGLW